MFLQGQAPRVLLPGRLINLRIIITYELSLLKICHSELAKNLRSQTLRKLRVTVCFIGWFDTPGPTGGILRTTNWAPPRPTGLFARFSDPVRHDTFWIPRRDTGIPIKTIWVQTPGMNAEDANIWIQGMANGMSAWNMVRSQAGSQLIRFEGWLNSGASTMTAEWSPLGYHIFGTFSRVSPGWGPEVGTFQITLNTRAIIQYAGSTAWEPLIHLIISTATHELGHAIGLRDGTIASPHEGWANSSVMNHGRCRRTITLPTAFDIMSFRMLHD